jgi:hypothetical protein
MSETDRIAKMTEAELREYVREQRRESRQRHGADCRCGFCVGLSRTDR